MEEIERRWESLSTLVGTRETAIVCDIDSQHFREGLKNLTELLETYDAWVEKTTHISDEMLELTRQLQQCKVCSIMYHVSYVSTEPSIKH